jgi:hypothetical protein
MGTSRYWINHLQQVANYLVVQRSDIKVHRYGFGELIAHF